MEIVAVDKAGRLVIPASIRKKMSIEEGTRFLLVEMKEKLVLEKLDKEEIARRLQDELKGVDIDRIVAGVEAEMNDRVRHEKRQVLG